MVTERKHAQQTKNLCVTRGRFFCYIPRRYKSPCYICTDAKVSTFESVIIVTLFSWLVGMIFVSLCRPCKGNECLTKFR